VPEESHRNVARHGSKRYRRYDCPAEKGGFESDRNRPIGYAGGLCISLARQRLTSRIWFLPLINKRGAVQVDSVGHDLGFCDDLRDLHRSAATGALPAPLAAASTHVPTHAQDLHGSSGSG
jgi:hypothetical protein